MKLLYFLLLFFGFANAAVPISNGHLSTPSPTATIIVSATSVCQNSGPVTITFTGSGGTAPYTFVYTLNGGSPITISTTATNNSISIAAPTTNAGTFNYSLVSVTDSADPTASQPVPGIASYIVKLKPDATLNGTGSGSVFNGIPVFRNCSNTVSEFNFTNGSSTTSINSLYSIDWGDGSPLYTSASFDALISHTYQIGLWNLTYTITGSNNCLTTKSYIVFVGSNPAVSLGNPGNTDICNATALTFPITGTANNPPGTIYTVTFNDGSAPVTFNHPPPASVTHTFLVSSCGTTSSDGSNSYPNSFFANIVASNPCSISSVGVVPIYVSTPPIANFTLPATTKCTNSAVCLTNTSVGNENFGSGSSCDTTPAIVWSISPNTGYTISSGMMGNAYNSSDYSIWSSGSDVICLVFTVPGTYTITLKTGNRCGIDTEVKTICIEAPLIPQFTLSPTNGCTALPVTATNTTITTTSCTPPSYQWNVTYAAGFCGTAMAPITYSGGTSATSANPIFNFTTPGTYSVSLTAANSCGPITSAVQTVVVKRPPTVSISAIANTCGTASITPMATVNNCAPTAETVSYAWSFPGGSPATSTNANPGVITYTVPNTYTVTLTVTNSCGSTTATTNFTVNVAPTITNTSLSQTICSGQQSTAIPLTTNPGGSTFVWTAVSSAGITGFIASGTSATIPQQTLINTASTPGTVTYTITPTFNNCAGASATYVITVNPAALINVQPIAAVACQNAVLSALSVGYINGVGTPTYQWYSNATASNTGGNPISGATGSSYVPPSTTIGTLYYYVVISLPSGGCSNLTSNAVAIMIAAPVSISVQPIASQTQCVGGAIPALSVSYSGGTGTATYQWYSNTSATNTGGTAISGATSASYLPGAFASVGSFYYYAVVSASGNGCGQASSTVATVNVISDPTVTISPASQTLCANAAATPITATATGGSGTFSYQWYSNTVNNTTSGTAIAGQTNATFTPLTTVVGIKYYYVVVTQTAAGCSATSATAMVQVNTAPSITTQPSGSTVCVGGTPATLSVGYVNGVGSPTYQWFSNTVNSTLGATAIPPATANSYQPSATSSGTTYYYVVISLPSGGCSTLTSAIVPVTVVDPVMITTQPIASQTLCVGGAIPALSVSYSGGTGTATYQWYSNTSATNTGGTAISGATSASYLPGAFASVGSFYYYVSVTLNGSGCATSTSAVAEVLVVADPLITAQPIGSQTVCSSATPATLVVTATGGVGTLLYEWYSSATNTTTGGTAIPGATSATYVPQTTSTGTTFYYVVITTTASGCSTTSATALVTVNPSPTFTQHPLPATVCQGATLSPLSVSYTNGTGMPSYQWYSNNVDNTATGTAILGETSPTYTPSAATIGTMYYYVQITLPPSAGCSILISNTGAITITSGTTISTQPLASQSICVGGTIVDPLTVASSGGTGTASYQWYSNTAAANSGGTAILGATQPNYTPTAYAAAGTYYYYAIISLNGNGCGPAVSEVAELIVVEDPTVTLLPASQTLCQLAAPETLSAVATGGFGTYSYQWFSNSTNSTAGATQITGATADTLIPDTSVVGTLYYFVQVSQTGAGCSATSPFVQVTINLAPSVSQQPASETVCLGAPLAVLNVNFSNGTGTPSYQWYSNSTNNTSGGVLIPGAINPSFTPPASTVGTTYYFVVITFPATGGCSGIVSDAAAITISPLPTISLQPQTLQSVCIGGSLPVSLSAAYQNGAGTASYQWYLNTTNANTGGTAISGATSPSYMPGVYSSAGNFYYYVVVTLSGNGCGSVASNTATVTVVADPVVDAQPIPMQEICQDSASQNLSVAVLGGAGSVYFYQWYQNSANSTVGGTAIPSANAPTFSPPSNSTGTLYYYVEVSQAPGAGCSVTSATSAVTVNPAATIVNQPASSTVCIDTTIQLSVSYGNGAGTPHYQWYSNTLNSTVGAVSIPAATTASYTPATNAAGTLYFYVVISFPMGGCGDLTSNIATVTVNPTPVIAASSQTICSGNSFTIVPDQTNGNIVPVGTTYSWGAPVVNPPGSISGSSGQSIQQTQISQTLVNSTSNPATVTYIVTPLAGVCVGAYFTVTITVNPSISPNVTISNSTCYNESNGSITTNITGGIPFPTVPYVVNWSGPGGFSASATSISNLAPGIYTLTISDAGGCPFTADFTITEPNEILIATDSQNDITCFGDADGAISVSVGGGTLPYQYTWTKGGTLFSNVDDIANLAPGTYILSVTDANNCGPATASFTILEPPLLTLALASQQNVLCFGAATGAIVVTVGGGMPVEVSPGVLSYTFSWTGPGGFTSSSQNLSMLVAGTYNLIVTDLHGCTKSLAVVITQTPQIVITAATTPITCYGANNASITLTVSGGVGPYTAAWSNLATGLFQDNLAAGTYLITITDSLGCDKPITVIIPDAPVFMVNPIVQQISCFGANDGSINLNLTGGIPPVSMTWTDGSTAGVIRNNLGPGTYSATISDGTPCHITRTFIIVEPQPLTITATTQNAFACNNATSGAIDVTVAGGTAPYLYAWSNGTTTEDLANITSGNYAVTVTDSRGCTKSATFTITRPAPIAIAMAVQTIANCATGSVQQVFTAQVSGGVAPFTYHWSSGTVSANNQTMTTSQNTTVVFDATDSLGCTASYTFDVDIPIIEDADFATTSIGYETYGVYSIVDPIQFTNAAQGDWTTISWNFGDGAFSTEENPVHSYVLEGDYVVTQTVTYPHGCVYTHVVTLIVKKGYFLVVPDAFTPNGDTMNDTFRPLAKGLQNVKLTVYDTWGSLLYSEEGTVLHGWDGKIKGQPAENGNYYCKVTAETFYHAIINVSHPFVLIN